MDFYYIVNKGEPPGHEGAANLGGTCAAWAQSKDKDQTEVICVSGMGGVIIRLTSAESEKIARDFLSPKIK
ncbi:MAG: hypothetical protein WAL89_07330 [Candidatus Sulfotelmatobacter sp.]|jgi:hypothetical protein